MGDFIATAEALRIAKKAQRKFLALWALECLIEDKRVLPRLAADVGRTQDRFGRSRRRFRRDEQE